MSTSWRKTHGPYVVVGETIDGQKERREAPYRLVSPDTLALLEALRLPTYAERCAAREKIRYRRRQRAHRWDAALAAHWSTAYQGAR